MENRLWKNIQRYMELRGFKTISALAEISGVSRQSLQRIKRTGTARMESLDKLAEKLGTNRAMLVS